MSESKILTEQLRDKALLALEDALQECRYRRPRDSFAVRFALAYLWVYGGRGDRRPYDVFWKELRSEYQASRFNTASNDLDAIYGALGVDRSEDVTGEMWRRWQAREQTSNRI